MTLNPTLHVDIEPCSALCASVLRVSRPWYGPHLGMQERGALSKSSLNPVVGNLSRPSPQAHRTQTNGPQDHAEEKPCKPPIKFYTTFVNPPRMKFADHCSELLAGSQSTCCAPLRQFNQFAVVKPCASSFGPCSFYDSVPLP